MKAGFALVVGVSALNTEKNPAGENTVTAEEPQVPVKSELQTWIDEKEKAVQLRKDLEEDKVNDEIVQRFKSEKGKTPSMMTNVSNLFKSVKTPEEERNKLETALKSKDEKYLRVKVTIAKSIDDKIADLDAKINEAQKTQLDKENDRLVAAREAHDKHINEEIATHFASHADMERINKLEDKHKIAELKALLKKEHAANQEDAKLKELHAAHEAHINAVARHEKRIRGHELYERNIFSKFWLLIVGLVVAAIGGGLILVGGIPQIAILSTIILGGVVAAVGLGMGAHAQWNSVSLDAADAAEAAAKAAADAAAAKVAADADAAAKAAI